MSIYEMSLDLKKSLPIYSDPIVLRQGDTNAEILVHVLDNSTPKNLENLHIEFHADKPDATTIDDDEQSHFTIGADKESFTYTVPDELTDASGSTTNTYFKIGNDSTSNFYIHILTKSGMEKLESGDYISKVDRIFNHVMSDYTAINELTETGKGTFDTALADSKKEMKDLMDNLNAEYVQFINSKTTDFNTFLANLDSQASDVKTKYTTLKAQLDALAVPVNAVGTNLYQDTRDFDNPSVWAPSENWSSWHKTGDKFNGLTVIATDGDWTGLGQNVQAKKGETYTFSVYARYQSGTGQSMMFFNTNGKDTGKPVSLSETWQRVTFTITLPNDGLMKTRIDRTNNNTNTLLIAGPKLERGAIATDYSLNPLEISTIEQLQTSAVGTNLIVKSDLKLGYINRDNGDITPSGGDFYSDNFIPTNGETTFTFSSPDHTFELAWGNTLAMYDSNKKYLGYQSITSATQTLTNSNTAYIRFSINFVDAGGTANNLSDWLSSHRYKLEKGSVATDYSLNPEEISTNDDVQTAIANAIKVDVGKTITATDDTGKTVKLNITGIS